MSQYDNPYASTGDYPTAAHEVKTSPLAVASFICSIIICCPVATLIGPILGLVSVIGISRHPGRRGMGWAISAIIIGLIVTAGWIGIGVVYYRLAEQFVQVLNAPQAIMQSIDDGNYAQARQNLGTAASNLSDDELKSFLDQAEARYGEFQTIQIAQQQQQNPPMGQTTFTLPYQVSFANGTQQADVTIEINPTGSFSAEFKIGAITIRDANQGDLRLPPTPGSP